MSNRDLSIALAIEWDVTLERYHRYVQLYYNYTTVILLLLATTTLFYEAYCIYASLLQMENHY